MTSSTIIKKMIDDVLKQSTIPGKFPETIKDNSQNNLLTIDLKFFNKNDPGWKLEPLMIESFSIYQDFEEKIGDIIDTIIQLKPYDALDLLNHYRELYCILTLTYCNILNFKPDLYRLPIIKTYRVFIKNRENLLRSLPIKRLLHNKQDSIVEKIPRMEEHAEMLKLIDMQLIDSISYKLDKSFVNCFIKNQTMDIGIKYITKCFNINSLNLIPPDNKIPIRHFYISPENSYFSTIYSYIQDKYGVYSKDLNYYYTNGILYIYPKNELDSTILKKGKNIYIVNADPMKVCGVNRLFKFSNLDKTTNRYTKLHIVNSLTNMSKSLNEFSSENSGTNIIFYKANRNIDMVQNQDPNNISIPKDNLQVLDTNDIGIIDKTQMNTILHSPINNVYKLTSKLTRYNFELFGIIIPNFIPFTQEPGYPFPIIPGEPITIFYDDAGKLAQEDGITISVLYSFVREKIINSKYYFLCNCQLILKIEQNEKITKTLDLYKPKEKKQTK